jgi:hypothetical protein
MFIVPHGDEHAAHPHFYVLSAWFVFTVMFGSEFVVLSSVRRALFRVGESANEPGTEHRTMNPEPNVESGHEQRTEKSEE